MTILNKSFNKLTVTKILSAVQVEAVCSCGTIKEYSIHNLISGNTNSCGCYKIEQTKLSNTKHGLSKHKLVKVLGSMKDRCYNKNTKNYHNYGGRGITVCDEWRNNFKSFYDWAIANGWEEGLQIDREDNNGNYEPNNCRFVTNQENSYNRRTTKLITFNGKTMNLKDWSKELNINYSTLTMRLNKYKWSVDKALRKEGNFVL